MVIANRRKIDHHGFGRMPPCPVSDLIEVFGERPNAVQVLRYTPTSDRIASSVVPDFQIDPANTSIELSCDRLVLGCGESFGLKGCQRTCRPDARTESRACRFCCRVKRVRVQIERSCVVCSRKSHIRERNIGKRWVCLDQTAHPKTGEGAGAGGGLRLGGPCFWGRTGVGFRRARRATAGCNSSQAQEGRNHAPAHCHVRVLSTGFSAL